MVEIVVNRKDAEPLRYAFDRGIITIGRDPSNEISLPSTTVAERHARVSLFDDICVIQRLDPEGALFVNGNEIDRTRVYDQDSVMIGPFKLSVQGKKLARKSYDPPPRAITKPQAPDSGSADDEPLPALNGRFEPIEDEKAGDGESAGEAPPAAGKPGHTEHHKAPPPKTDVPRTSLLSTGVDVLTGPAKGRRILFTGKSARLGLKDDPVIAIKPSQHGYMVSATNHFVVATLNGKRLTDKPERLSHGDQIEFTDLKARFFVSPE